MKRLLLTIIATLVFVGCTPDLHKAAREGDADRVRELLDAGADVNVRNADKQRLQYTPLHWAAYYGHLEIAEILISRGADLDAEDPDYSTPLYLAAEQGYPEVVKFLISKGAKVNVKSARWGYTPLHRAAWGPVARRFGQHAETFGAEPEEDYKEIVAFLIAKGADINARDNDGKTAFDQATRSDKGETAALLRKNGAEHGTIDAAAYGGDIEAVKGFLANGVEVNVKGGSIMGTPLHYAAQAGHLDIVELLLAKGAEVNVTIQVEGGIFNGKTPMDRANSFNHTKIADLLRKHGGKTGEELKAVEPASSGKFKDYYLGPVKIRFREAELAEELKQSPWTGYGVDGGFPGTVVSALEITDASGAYSLPADMVNDLGNPNIGHVRVSQKGKLLELSMTNSDGAGGHHVLFQVDLAKAQACRFVRVIIEDDFTKTHDWTALRKKR
jgi:ankyrin repeat protein